MKLVKLFLVLAFATASTTAFAAGWSADDSSATTATTAQGDMPRTGRTFVVQNESQKHRLEAQGFPQYND